MKSFLGKNRLSIPSEHGKMKGCSARSLRMEALEEREMLAVTAAEFSTIRGMYPDLGITANMSDYNVIDVTTLTAQSLQGAISSAASSAKSDLIVLRTTSSSNTITLAGTELSISINATNSGGVTIVSLGSGKVTINANQQSRIFNIQNSTVGLGGVVITNGKITSGDTATGGGIYSKNSILTLSDCIVSQNSVLLNAPYPAGDALGGGIRATDGKLMIYNSELSGNDAQANGPFYFSAGGGGIFSANAELIIKNSKICDNTTSVTPSQPNRGSSWATGAGISYNSGNGFVLENSIVSGNVATSYSGGGSSGPGGGGILHYGGTAYLINSEISNNTYIGRKRLRRESALDGNRLVIPHTSLLSCSS